MKKISLTLMSLLVLAGASIGESQAAARPGRCSKPDYTRADLNAATVTINQSDPVGTVYPLSYTFTQGDMATIYCNARLSTPGTLLNAFYLSSRFVSAMDFLGNAKFDIGVPGLAVRIQNPDGYQNAKVPGFPVGYPTYVYSGVTRFWNGRGTPIKLSLIKTATTVKLPAGEHIVKMGDHQIPTTAITNYVHGNTETIYQSRVSTWYLYMRFKELVPTCAFKSDRVTFPLGEVPEETFKQPGSTSPWVTRSLVSAGCTSVKKVHMTFQGTANRDDKNLFAVTGGAEGIGVELKSFDNVAAIPDNTTRMSWNPRADGSNYEFKTRYRKTSSALKSGEANANITVNLTYD